MKTIDDKNTDLVLMPGSSLSFGNFGGDGSGSGFGGTSTALVVSPAVPQESEIVAETGVVKIEFKKSLLKDREDSDYIEEQLAAWKVEGIAECDQSEDWKAYENARFKINKKNDTLAGKIQKIKERTKEQVDNIKDKIAKKDHDLDAESVLKAVAQWKEYMKTHELFFVAAQGTYFEYNNKTFDWLGPFKEFALYKTLGIEGDDVQRQAFEAVMDDRGAYYKQQTNTFKDVHADVLNRMRTDHWLKPEDADNQRHHWMFDVLLQSIGNSSVDASDYIESWISYKYRKTADYKLPALILYGVEGTGKNILVDDVLVTIFGEAQCKKLSTEEAFGKFNSMLSGNVITFIDEPDALNNYRGKIYTTLNNSRFNVELKGVDAFKVDATSAFIMSGNDRSATVFLNDKSNNRRFSPIKGTRDCYNILMDFMNKKIVESSGADALLINRDEAGQIWDDNEHVFTDPVEVRRWLKYIIEKHQSDVRPAAFRDEFYAEIVESNKDVLTLVLEGIFLDPNFRNISWDTLWEAYQIAYSDVNTGRMNYIKTRPSFEIDAKNWLKDNEIHVSTRSVKITNRKTNKRSNSRREIVADGVGVVRGDKIFKSYDAYIHSGPLLKLSTLLFELGSEQYKNAAQLSVVKQLPDDFEELGDDFEELGDNF